MPRSGNRVMSPADVGRDGNHGAALHGHHCSASFLHCRRQAVTSGPRWPERGHAPALVPVTSEPGTALAVRRRQPNICSLTFAR